MGDATSPGYTPDPAELLGTVRSGLDRDEVQLPPQFQQLQRDVDGVLAELDAGALDAPEAAARLAELRVFDDQGLEWTLGATTRTWYRRVPGGAWTEALPPLVYVGSDGDPLADDAAAGGGELGGLSPEQLRRPPDGAAADEPPSPPPLR